MTPSLTEAAKLAREALDALKRIATIEIERGMDADEAIERGMSAIHFARQALSAQAVAVAEPVALPDQTDFSRWVGRAYRDAFASDQTFSIHNMRVAYTAGMNREAIRNSAAPLATPPAQPAAVWTQEQCDKVVTLGAELRARFKPDRPAAPVATMLPELPRGCSAGLRDLYETTFDTDDMRAYAQAYHADVDALTRQLLACNVHDPARKHPDNSPAKGRWSVITAPTELVDALRAALEGLA